jgi:hypothetical protein
MLKKKLKIESISVKNRELVITSISDDLKEQADKTLSEIKGSKQLHSYKLAQENARYMISVFTPTSMIYTVSYRQAMLTSQYLDRLVTDCKSLSDRFSVRISKEAQTLSTALQAAIGGNVIEDNKDQYLRFLPYQHSGYEYEALRKTDYFGDSYTSTREMSMACLAQAQRHRTLRYTMYLQKPGQFGFYIPKIISESGMTLEWLNDMRSVEEIIPQGTLVRVTEQGIFEDFVLKCKERMCGRAQLEILKDTESLIYQFVKYKANLSMENKEILKDIFNYNTVCANARCKYSGFNCAEPCRWGAKHATTRYI